LDILFIGGDNNGKKLTLCNILAMKFFLSQFLVEYYHFLDVLGFLYASGT